MPLLDEVEVSPLPLPTRLDQLGPDTDIWVIRQTGEIFTDYESYANRYIFYAQPIFTPHLIPRSSTPCVSFFEAINQEHAQLDHLIHTNFPRALKNRILAAIQHPAAQLQQNLDQLVDYLYQLYHNRFHVGEKVSLDLNYNYHQHSESTSTASSSSIYDAKVVRVFPPKSIRDLDKHSYDDLIHLQSVDRFPLDLEKCLDIDDPAAYLYTIQLIDNNDQSKSDQFGTSYMEVETKKLSRHTDTFSKALLKRFLQSILIPYSSTHPPLPRWVIHPDVSIPTVIPVPPIPVPSYQSILKNKQISSRVLQENSLLQIENHNNCTKKRKKSSFQINHSAEVLLEDPSYQDHHAHHSTDLNQLRTQLSSKQKAQLTEQPLDPNNPDYSINASTPKKQQHQPPKKKKKTSDSTTALLNGHPLTINIQPLQHQDDPTLNMISTTTSTPITAIKETKKTIKYPIEDLDLDPFTIIDGRYLRRANPTPLKLPQKPQPTRQKLGRKFAQRLKIWSFVNIFKLNERRCRFEELEQSLDDLTASLVKIILSQTRLRYPTTRTQRFTSISVLPFFATHPAQECQVMDIDEREYWVRKGLRFVNVTKRLHAFVLATASSKRKNSRPMLEEDWVMGLVEIMCHRGGIERLGCMARMLKYLFSTDATLLTIDHTMDHDDEVVDPVNDPQKLLNKTKNEHSNNPQTSMTGFDGDSPLSSNLDDSLTVQESDLSGDEGQEKEEEDVEPEAGTETADEDGRRYGRSIRSQRNNPRQLRKTLMSRYADLPVDDKLNLMEFLCDLATESDQVRNYMEECDEKLTVVRREKADVNKEKRKVLEELARLESRRAEASLKTQPSSATELGSRTIPNESSPIARRVAAQQRQEPPSQPASAPPPSEKGLSNNEGLAHTERPDKDGKPRPAQIITPPYSRSMSHDSPTKSDSPQTRSQFKKAESTKPSAPFRPLETAVRTATLLTRQIKPPSASQSGDDPLGREKQELEGQLFEIGLRELMFQERFRQLIGVAKLKPLGMDRFFCKYWWFDGIGGLEIHAEDEHSHGASGQDEEKEDGTGKQQPETNWYAGCIFVSGPTVDEWDKISAAYGGHHHLLRRRFHEELGNVDLLHLPANKELALDLELKEQLIGVDEWGIYENEEQIDELFGWLNAKGVRENSLKVNLKDWKEYIYDGYHRRRSLHSSSSSQEQQQQQQDREGLTEDKVLDGNTLAELLPSVQPDQMDGLDGSSLNTEDDGGDHVSNI
ncbi:hypothetical protein PCANC_20306 [Puccinia coronata f. sp. avenae]|uniref:WAC domain-containing protein n=1 Tax=Puccinia coronata f. sp. avenae TaxID=200324 RepID=A0A2N5SDC4_9BASI|nr:hypothetical protein PCANC_20306 [Puccinia coronata f. sp. avenae]PLW42377.1 hypothetical protein PCASD_06406 [Puccinia coronata f. sp. avenae]